MGDLVWAAGAGLAIGAGMGLYAMIRPGWAAWLVRLNPDTGRPGGVGEFRATFGAFVFFNHAPALVLFDGDRLRQISRLVDVRAFLDGHMVGQQLQRDDRDDGLDGPLAVR